MSPVHRHTAGLGLLGLLLVALAGCGLITAAAPTTVQLLVTSEFGARVVHRSGALQASAHETVLGLLRRYDAVQERLGKGPDERCCALAVAAVVQIPPDVVARMHASRSRRARALYAVDVVEPLR
ncbi:MAG TPA: hypothetical protein VK655_04290, partial [Solirubrobacteraceae bacterium]|nr:hypothetical protein [Solirubrobacteraceae bacterium]